jgi:hypothetical protein
MMDSDPEELENKQSEFYNFANLVPWEFLGLCAGDRNPGRAQWTPGVEKPSVWGIQDGWSL